MHAHLKSLVAVVFALMLANLTASTSGKIRVLIIDGCSNHDWQLTTRCIQAILQPTNLFEVSVSTSPDNSAAPGWDTWRPKFSDYDVVVQQYNDLNGGAPWPAEVRTALEQFVHQGGGLYVWHSGNNAFPDWPAYNQMIGLGWRKKEAGPALQISDAGAIISIPAGTGDNTSHGKRFDALIIRRGEHPIHAGLPLRWKAANIEVYNFPRGPAENIEVLSYANDEVKTKLNWPIEWTVTYGQGLVYTSTFGHIWKGDTQPVTARDAGVQTIVVRALQWLAKRPVTYPVPADFPTEFATSVRGDLPLSPR